ncbi:4'-phosphopantetheinyl transferase superfamily protein [Streptomyces sp. NBC_01023]|uniref:4'-phosphopantetheinyl transferase family protein n=1 Tax=Streptomyces sp. NBC_01023 TaxID=2903724 RepID=UPI00386D7DE0|nr:4'-phosphopantetheinyl transferase superfamily protein [Streptomyces sp. NBC_01023]
MNPSRARVLLWCVSTGATARVTAVARELLPAQDRERMAQLRSAADRDAFALSHAVLARCLGALTGVAPTALRFALQTEGKPELVDQGPGDRLAFSLSHTAGLTLLAVTRGSPVGTDVERVRPVAAARIAQRYFPADEAAAVAARTERTAPELFFRLWVRKEAGVKAWGGRLVQGLGTRVCTAADDRPGAVTTRGPDGRTWRVRDLACVPAPYLAAVAVPRDEGEGPIEVRTLSVDQLLDRGPAAGHAFRDDPPADRRGPPTAARA